MMKYEILGGGYVEAPTALGLVEALRQDAMAWVPSVSIEDYMEGMAARCKIQNGAVVSTLDPHSFIIDLVAGGFLLVPRPA
jgi:hypothetical protein